MIKRRKLQLVLDRLTWSPAVMLMGPRQVGKTTLAREVQRHLEQQGRATEYLDLERSRDLERLGDADAYLEAREDKFIILDEVQRVPELFPTLRGLIDRGIKRGRDAGRFILIGSASARLLCREESLAGRATHVELDPLDVSEIETRDRNRLWLRGGFPRSFLASDAQGSLSRREDAIDAGLTGDFSWLVQDRSGRVLRALLKMLAREQGAVLNAARFAESLQVDGKTVARYLVFLDDLLLVRYLPAHFLGVKKRLVRSPEIYVRDSGILHSLLDIGSLKDLREHPVAEASWKGFVIENLLANAPRSATATFYRAAAGGAEIDLVLDLHGLHRPWAVEISRSDRPTPSEEFLKARDDIEAERSFVVCPAEGHRECGQGVEVIGVRELAELLRAEDPSRRTAESGD